MKASVVLAHPYEKSFNHALFAACVGALRSRGVEVFATDLYLDAFNPVLGRDELGKKPTADPLVRRYTLELDASDLLVFIHPNWWGQPPAILKGYIDRVFRPPVAYDFPEGATGGGLPIPKLGDKAAIVINTSNTEEGREESIFGDPLEDEWIRCVFGFCGLTRATRRTFRVVAESDESTRQSWLDEARRLMNQAVDRRTD